MSVERRLDFDPTEIGDEPDEMISQPGVPRYRPSKRELHKTQDQYRHDVPTLGEIEAAKRKREFEAEQEAKSRQEAEEKAAANLPPVRDILDKMKRADKEGHWPED